MAARILLTLAIVVAGLSAPGTGGAALSAQASNPCTLLPLNEVQPLAPETAMAEGVAIPGQTAGYGSCRYTWGSATGQFRLNVIVNDATRMFAGMSPEQIKRHLETLVSPGTSDAVISDVGEAAVFKAYSAVQASTTALLKGRILQVQLDGLYARDMKEQMIALLRSAASRL